MATYKIWLVGTEDVCIEEANSEREACKKSGWDPTECEVQIIPERYIVREHEAAVS